MVIKGIRNISNHKAPHHLGETAAISSKNAVLAPKTPKRHRNTDSNVTKQSKTKAAKAAETKGVGAALGTSLFPLGISYSLFQIFQPYPRNLTSLAHADTSISLTCAQSHLNFRFPNRDY